MTIEELRKIDALVATKVMGWKRNGGWPADRVEYGCWAEGTHPSHGGRVRWCEPDSEGLDCLNDAEIWSPSTDPAAMMVVIDEMDRRGFGIHITRVLSVSDGSRSWMVDLNQPRDDGDYGNGDHVSMCVAVCLAALRACAVPEPEIQAAQEAP